MWHHLLKPPTFLSLGPIVTYSLIICIMDSSHPQMIPESLACNWDSLVRLKDTWVALVLLEKFTFKKKFGAPLYLFMI